MEERTFWRVTAVLCLAALCCAGCGYTAGFKMPEGVETIYVKVFENRTFYRELDFDLTQLVKREILSRTDLKVVREKEADIVLACSVNKCEEFVLQEDEFDNPQEMELRLSISAVAKDRTGKVVFRARELRRSVSYVITLGEDEEFARSRALREIAEELVYRMAEHWGWEKEEDKTETEDTKEVVSEGSEEEG